MFDFHFRKKNRDTYPDDEVTELRHQLDRARKQLLEENARILGWRQVAVDARLNASNLLAELTHAKATIAALRDEVRMQQAQRSAADRSEPEQAIVLGSGLKRRLAELVLNGTPHPHPSQEAA